MTSNTQPQDLVNDQNDDDAALDRKPSRYSFDEASHRDEDSQHDERKGDRARIRRCVEMQWQLDGKLARNSATLFKRPYFFYINTKI